MSTFRSTDLRIYRYVHEGVYDPHRHPEATSYSPIAKETIRQTRDLTIESMLIMTIQCVLRVQYTDYRNRHKLTYDLLFGSKGRRIRMR